MKLTDTASQSNSTAGELGALQAEAESLDKTVKELAEQLEFIKNSDIQGEKSQTWIINDPVSTHLILSKNKQKSVLITALNLY